MPPAVVQEYDVNQNQDIKQTQNGEISIQQHGYMLEVEFNNGQTSYLENRALKMIAQKALGNGVRVEAEGEHSYILRGATIFTKTQIENIAKTLESQCNGKMKILNIDYM